MYSQYLPSLKTNYPEWCEINRLKASTRRDTVNYIHEQVHLDLHQVQWKSMHIIGSYDIIIYHN